MAYAQPFLRLVVSGTIANGAEQFSYGLSLINDFGTGTPPTEVPQGVIDAVTDFHSLGTVMAGTSRVNLIKLNEIGTDGRYTSNDETVLHELDPPVGPSGGNNHPPQVALAVSLMTDRARGRAARGRFYIPVGPAVALDGRLSTGNRDTILTAAYTFVSAINSAVPGYDVGIVSNIGSGAQAAVTKIRVGRALDTLRSRRRSLEEDYAESPEITEVPGDG